MRGDLLTRGKCLLAVHPDEYDYMYLDLINLLRNKVMPYLVNKQRDHFFNRGR